MLRGVESKAMHGMDRATERRFCNLIEDLGGGPADGHGRLGAEALNADGPTFDRAAELWYAERQPESEAERHALDRWRL